MNEDVAFLILAPLLIVFLAAITFLISRISGWNSLAQKYPLRATFPKPKIWLGYGVLRGWIGYNGGVIVASDSRGLYLRAIPIILSFCQAPIFIPWSEIRAIEACSRFFQGVPHSRCSRTRSGFRSTSGNLRIDSSGRERSGSARRILSLLSLAELPNIVFSHSEGGARRIS